MNIGDRIIVKSNHKNTIEFHRGYIPKVYTIKTADAPRLWHIFNKDPWPATTRFLPDGTIEVEYAVSDRELDDGFFSPDLDPDPLAPYWDFQETMNDFVESTRS